MDWDRYLAANGELEEVLSEAPDGVTSLYKRMEQRRPLKKAEEDRVLDLMKGVICANFGVLEWPTGGAFGCASQDNHCSRGDITEPDPPVVETCEFSAPGDEDSSRERLQSPFPLDRPVICLSRTPSGAEGDE